MTTNGSPAAEREAFARVLGIYGADQTRWPAQDRSRFRRLVGHDGAARTLLRETEALDRLLARAPRPSRARERALADRIFAAAADAGERARPTPAPPAAIPMPAGMVRGRLAQAARRPGLWQSAALLAASLLLGVYIGTAGNQAPVLQGMVDAAALLAQADPLAVAVRDDSAAFDEDAL